MPDVSRSPLLQHMESFLGNAQCAWKDSDREPWPFYVLRFGGGPIRDMLTFSTLGLSDTPLTSARSGKTFRQELVFMVRSDFGDRSIPALLKQVGTDLLGRREPLLQGEVVGPRGRLFEGTEMEALYPSIPVYLPEAFAVHKQPDGERRMFVWLIPITAREADFVRRNGSDQFEDLLEKLDPDLIDMHRGATA